MLDSHAADSVKCDDYGTGVIVSTNRDQRVLDFLVAKVGCERLKQARLELPGQRRAYVSNIAKILKIPVPEEVLITSREEGRQYLSNIKVFLNSKFDR